MDLMKLLDDQLITEDDLDQYKHILRKLYDIENYYVLKALGEYCRNESDRIMREQLDDND